MPSKATNETPGEQLERAVLHFWDQMDKTDADACWEYQGPGILHRQTGGYAGIGPTFLAQWAGSARAHVVAFVLATGVKNRRGKDVCHTCDNPPCCNPRHLFLGTRKENMADAKHKGRTSKPPVKLPLFDHVRAAIVVTLIVRHKVKQYQLAKALGVCSTIVNRIVRGKYKCR